MEPGDSGVGEGTHLPAGWYPDPAGYPRSRWWDGAHWTMHLNRPFAADALESAGAPRSPEEQLAILLSPSLIAFFIIGFTAPWVTIFCAYRDWRGLQSAQLAQPFHWAWSFLTLSGYPVYSIGRAIVTNRRAKQGMWVLWTTIGVFVLVTVATIVLTFSFSVNSLL